MSALTKTFAAGVLLACAGNTLYAMSNLVSKTGEDFKQEYPSISSSDAERLRKQDQTNDLGFVSSGLAGIYGALSLLKRKTVQPIAKPIAP